MRTTAARPGPSALLLAAALTACGSGGAGGGGAPQPEVLQRWEAPTTWGAVWPDGPTMRQHATFDASGNVVEHVAGIAWSLVGGPLPPVKPFAGLLSDTRYGVGPFDGASAPRFQATGGDAALDLPGDMIVCAVVKPDHDPTFRQESKARAILAKGYGIDQVSVPGGGWVLMQMHSQFCFHYQAKDSTGATFQNMAFTPTYFADEDTPATGPLNPSLVVVCGGRDGDTIVAAANGYDGATVFGPFALAGGGGTGPWTLDAATTFHATLGGYDPTFPRPPTAPRPPEVPADHQYGGRVYETAVWAEPATRENLQAKMAAVLGLRLNAEDPTPVTYTRNREAPYLGPDGAGLAYHTAWRHGPRLDPAKGMLFGLQGWNRLSTCVTDAGAAIACDDPSTTDRFVSAPGEKLERWTMAGGASASTASPILPPGDSERASVALLSLPPGGSLSSPLAAFDTPGPVHGQIWLRVPAATSGAIRFTTSNPLAPGDAAEVDLATLAPGIWTRFWLADLTTTAAAGTFRIEAPSTNPGPVQLHALGADLTQLSGGGDLGAFDPGPVMYDWSAPIGLYGGLLVNGGLRPAPERLQEQPRFAVDVLELPPTPSTPPAGFCLAADAQPYDGLDWKAPFAGSRGLAGWVGRGVAAQLLATGTASSGGPGRLCFTLASGSGSQSACAPVPASWTAGSRHRVAGCLSATGSLRLYGDDRQLGATVTGASPLPDLTKGHVVVGNLAGTDPSLWPLTGDPAPWDGYVAKVVVCSDAGGVAITACR